MPDQATATLVDLGDLASHAGTSLGTSGWRLVTQTDVDTFARLTGDEQWIHIDPERAKKGPFGTTIAHGFLTLSLLSHLIESTFSFGAAEVRERAGPRHSALMFSFKIM